MAQSEAEVSSKSDRDELEKLLDLADSVRSRIDDMEYRIQRFRVMQFSTLMLCVFSIVVAYSMSVADSGTGLLLVGSAIFFIASVYIWTVELAVRRIRARLKPEVVFIKRLLSLIRETENIVSSFEGWSPLERAHFHLRLSRFDI